MSYKPVEEHRFQLARLYKGEVDISLASPPDERLQILVVRPAGDADGVSPAIIERMRRIVRSFNERSRKLMDVAGITLCLVDGTLEDTVPDVGKRDEMFLKEGYVAVDSRILVMPGERIVTEKRYSSSAKRWFENEEFRFEHHCLMRSVGTASDRINWQEAALELTRPDGEGSYEYNETDYYSAIGFLNTARLAIAEGKEGEFAKRCPKVHRAWYEYERFLEERYQALLSKERAEQAANYSATDEAFGVNGEALTLPQVEFFTLVNKVIGLSSTSPGDFDTSFRKSATRILARVVREYEMRGGPSGFVRSSWIDVVEKADVYFGCNRPEFSMNTGNGFREPGVIGRALQAVARKGAALTAALLRNPNIIQQFSSGERGALSDIPVHMEVNGCMIPIREIFFGAVVEAGESVMRDNGGGVEGAQALVTQLRGLREEIFLTPKEYEQWQRREGRRGRSRVLSVSGEYRPLESAIAAVEAEGGAPLPQMTLPHESFIGMLWHRISTENELLDELNRLGRFLNADTERYGKVSDLLLDPRGGLFLAIRGFYVFQNRPEKLANQLAEIESLMVGARNTLLSALPEHQELARALMDCPIILAFLTGDVEIIKGAFGLRDDSERREYTEVFILPNWQTEVGQKGWGDLISGDVRSSSGVAQRG